MTSAMSTQMQTTQMQVLQRRSELPVWARKPKDIVVLGADCVFAPPADRELLSD